MRLRVELHCRRQQRNLLNGVINTVKRPVERCLLEHLIVHLKYLQLTKPNWMAGSSDLMIKHTLNTNLFMIIQSILIKIQEVFSGHQMMDLMEVQNK